MASSARGMRVLSGLAAAAVAVGVVQLLAAVFGPSADARAAVGSTVIDLTPGPVKEWAIQRFGTSDKLFLTVMVLVVIAAVAAIAAIWETRRRPLASAVLVAGGIAGCAAVLSRAAAAPVDVIPTVVGTLCGIAVLRLLVVPRRSGVGETVAQEHDSGRRRAFAALGLLGLGAIGVGGGTVLMRRLHSVAGDRNAFTPPPLAATAAPIPPDVQPNGVALTRFITPNDKFYRIDTALNVPQLSRTDWRLKIHGMTDREVTFRFEDLGRFDLIEKVVTLTCVSNPVGGNLISTATWTGYRVRDLLAGAGIHNDADMVLSTSIDGFTVGTPVEALIDNCDALLAITMNGEPLPTEHGYPARLVVPGLYGYVSATKWVVDLELTRFDRAQAYWTGLGWAERAPIKTASRIDVPASFQKFAPGPVTFGGVAWAQNRGIRAVEVRIDKAEWRPADLGANYANDTWRLWSYHWEATPGLHTITVRATDNTGAVQTSERAEPIPDGATGWNSVSFSVA